MKQIEIQRTHAGYILCFSRPIRRLCLGTASFFFILNTTAATIPWLLHGQYPPVFLILSSILWGTGAVGFLLFMIRSASFRLVADAQGVHRYTFGRVNRTFLWRHIRSCGIEEIPPAENEGRVMLPSFYVSTEKPVENMKNCLFIRVNKEDEQSIRESGLLSFCRTQMENADRTSL